VVIQSFKLSGLDEKVNECGGSEWRLDWMNGWFIHCDFGLVRIGLMGRMYGLFWLLLVVGDCC
jgi:hypothetical protein